MVTKNSNQRYHFVLAENLQTAKPITDRMIKNGMRPNRINFVDSSLVLMGIRGKDCAFIFGPGYDKHPNWEHIQERVWVLMDEGAVKKADPEAAYQRAKVKREEKEHKAQQLADPFDAQEAPKRYKQYLLGGPAHARRYLGLQVTEEGRVVVVNGTDYRSYAAEILGEKAIFWVNVGQWPDRQRLVREFVLLALEA